MWEHREKLQNIYGGQDRLTYSPQNVGAPREISLEQQDPPTCTRPTLGATPSPPARLEVNHKGSKHSLIWLIKAKQQTKTKWLAQKTVQKDMCMYIYTSQPHTYQNATCSV